MSTGLTINFLHELLTQLGLLVEVSHLAIFILPYDDNLAIASLLD